MGSGPYFIQPEELLMEQTLGIAHFLSHVDGVGRFLLVTLLEDKERLPVAGKVIWVTPPGAQGNRVAGIGVQFADTNEGEAVRGKIETLLAGILNSDKPTQTM